MKHHFAIRCNPPKSTHQASLRIIKKKDGSQFVGKFDGSKAKQAKRTMTDLFKEHRPFIPFEGAVFLSVTWAYPWRKSEPKKNKVKGWAYCVTRPDCDNLAKIAQDVMTELNFWNDDAQVAVLNFIKIYSDKPRIEIEIKELK